MTFPLKEFIGVRGTIPLVLVKLTDRQKLIVDILKEGSLIRYTVSQILMLDDEKAEKTAFGPVKS